MSLEEAIKEVRELREWDKAKRLKAEEQDRLRILKCPDCSATLKIETQGELPADLRVVFVSHADCESEHDEDKSSIEEVANV